MKKLITFLSLALVLTMLACSFAGCAPKSNMLDMARAVVDGKVPDSLINIEQIEGTKNADGYGYDVSGYSDYTENSYKLEAGAGGYIGAKHSATLRQTVTEINIKGGTEEGNYNDYSKYSLKSHLRWSFDDVDEKGDFINGYITYEVKNMPDTPDTYFYVEYTLYDIESFTANVDSSEGFFNAEDLATVEISRYGSDEGEFGWDDLTEEEKLLFMLSINQDLAKLVKTCADAGYPVESR